MTNLLVPRRNRVRRAAPVFGLAGGLDSILDEVWRGFDFPLSRAAEPGAKAPRMDFRETEDEIEIAAELPGMEEKDIEVSVEDDILTVKGERTDEKTEADEEKGWRRVETFRGCFQRSVRLPEGVDANAVKASYKAGMLTVTIPKPAEAKPEVKTIPVETA